MTSRIRKGRVNANGAQLYHEARGNGPSVLFIAGATGDGGHFVRVAELLANEFTVVTYDRRGNSRSPRPAGWSKMTMTEQADDAAALLKALGLAPAVVFGNSGGAIITIELLMRHPQAMRGAIVHEPPVFAVLPKADELKGQFQQRTQTALSSGGARGAMELFIRTEGGNAVFESLDPELRERMLGIPGAVRSVCARIDEPACLPTHQPLHSSDRFQGLQSVLAENEQPPDLSPVSAR